MSRLARSSTLAGLIGAFLVVVPVAAEATAPVAPFNDPAAVSTLTFCDFTGRAITQGLLSSKPFVWKAIADSQQAAPYNDSSTKATLAIFVPQQGVPPTQWVGESMTATSSYTPITKPAVQATSLDSSLSNFLAAFVSHWDGLLEVRLILNHSAYGPSANYAAAIIQVKGGTWSVVGAPGHSACSSSRAVSAEIKDLSLPANGVAPAVNPTAKPSPTVSMGQYGTADDPVKSTGTTAALAAAASTRGVGGSSLAKMWTVLGGVVAIALIGAAFFLGRRTGHRSA